MPRRDIAKQGSRRGASLAIESSVPLTRCLRDLSHEEAFAAYERLRPARVERIIATATRTNRNKANPFARVLRDLLTPVAMKVAMVKARVRVAARVASVRRPGPRASPATCSKTTPAFPPSSSA